MSQAPQILPRVKHEPSIHGALGRVCHDADSFAERLEPHTFRLEIDWHVLAVVENHEAPSIPEDNHVAGCAVRARLGSIILHGRPGSDFIDGIHRQPIHFLHAHRPRLGWVHSMSHSRAAARRVRPHWNVQRPVLREEADGSV